MTFRDRDLARVEFQSKKGNGECLRVVFVTTTYPSVDLPQGNIFTHRSIKALSSEVEGVVISISAWKPGTPVVSNREYEGVQVVSFACPLVPLPPSVKPSPITYLFAIHFGWYFVLPYLERADIIHAASLYPESFIASHWARRVDKPHTTHAIGSDVNFLLPKVLGSTFLHSPWHIDGTVCNSSEIMKKVIRLFPSNQNIKVVYRGVDTDKYSPLGAQTENALPHAPLRYLFLGGFHAWDPNHPFYNIKGGPILLQAWQRVESQVAPDVLVIGGPGVDTFRMHLEKWRSSLSRPDAVSFLSALQPDSVPDAIRGSDVVVIPSLFEGLPNLSREAQACGRPVLGSDAGGIPEVIIHDETGIIVPRGSVNELASGFSWFHAHPSRIGAMGMQGRNRMMQEFSWERFSINMMDFFHSVIGAHSSAS